MRCYDEGALRAYLDDALLAVERDSIAAHLLGCPACRGLLDQLQTQAAQVASLLAPALAPDPRQALARFQETGDRRQETGDRSRESQQESVVGGQWSVVNDNTQHPTRKTHRLSWRSMMQNSY